MKESGDDALGSQFERFCDLIARLRGPGGCPWDREQTHETLKPMTIEEAYEVVEAIDQGDRQLAGELGDLLLQVVFHAQIAADEGRFGIRDVIASVQDKMVRRHPHVFADDPADTPEKVLRNWEALKQAERQAEGKGAGTESLLDGVPKSLPAVLEAFQMTTKAARVGFDWRDAEAVFAKLEEEADELRSALALPERDARRVAEELGDLMFVLVNLARRLGVDPESALKAANRKFRRRFAHVEAGLVRSGRRLGEAGLAEMDALWDEAKASERDGA